MPYLHRCSLISSRTLSQIPPPPPELANVEADYFYELTLDNQRAALAYDQDKTIFAAGQHEFPILKSLVLTLASKEGVTANVWVNHELLGSQPNRRSALCLTLATREYLDGIGWTTHSVLRERPGLKEFLRGLDIDVTKGKWYASRR